MLAPRRRRAVGIRHRVTLPLGYSIQLLHDLGKHRRQLEYKLLLISGQLDLWIYPHSLLVGTMSGVAPLICTAPFQSKRTRCHRAFRRKSKRGYVPKFDWAIVAS